MAAKKVAHTRAVIDLGVDGAQEVEKELKQIFQLQEKIVNNKNNTISYEIDFDSDDLVTL